MCTFSMRKTGVGFHTIFFSRCASVGRLMRFDEFIDALRVL